MNERHSVGVSYPTGRAECSCGKWWTTTGANSADLNRLAWEHVKNARATADRYHVGWPLDPAEALERVKRGLPVYWPTDPKPLAQDAYIQFAELRGPNSD